MSCWVTHTCLVHIWEYHLPPEAVLQVSQNGYKQVPGDILSGMFPEAEGYRMVP